MQQDLWAALQSQANEEGVVLPVSIETIMETWTRQMGFPVITVNRTYDANNSAIASQVYCLSIFKLFPIVILLSSTAKIFVAQKRKFNRPERLQLVGTTHLHQQLFRSCGVLLDAQR